MARGLFESIDWLIAKDKKICCLIDNINNELAAKITNELGTPSFRSDTLVNLPAAGQTGRMFISTDTFAFYRDNGTGWDLIGGPGIGTVTGSGTTNYLPKWTGSTALGNSLVFDNGTSVGVNTSTPTSGFTLDNNGAFRNYGQAAFLMNTGDAGGGNAAVGLGILPASVSRISGERVLEIFSYYSTLRLRDTNPNYTFEISLGTPKIPIVGTTNAQPWDIQTNGTRIGRFYSNGNFSFGSLTDAGYKLDVNGTARVSGTTTGGSLELANINATIGAGNGFGKAAFNVTNTYTGSGSYFWTAKFQQAGTVGGGSNYQSGVQINNLNSAVALSVNQGTGQGTNTIGGYPVVGVDVTSSGDTYSYRLFTNGKFPSILTHHYNNTTTSAFDNCITQYRSKGDGTTIVLLSGGELLGGIQFGTATVVSNNWVSQANKVSASIRSFATAAPSGSNTSGDLRFSTSDNSVATERMRLTDTGILALGTTSPDASALLDITSTTKGFLPPRMTGAQAEAITSPAEGLMVYSTDGSGTTITSKGWWGFEGATWVKLN